MRVIGAGFGRTGTTSLKAALEELGFGPSYTLGEVFRKPEHVRLWEAAADTDAGQEVDWEAHTCSQTLRSRAVATLGESEGLVTSA